MIDPRDVAARVGHTRQVARIDRLLHDDGPARGSRLVRVVTGGGLEFELYPDRCLDVGAVTFRGVPVAWASPIPPTRGERFDPVEGGWTETFSGGLVVTCGLDTFGSSSVDDGEQLGLHGRATSLVASDLATVSPRGPSTVMSVSGTMEQATLWGRRLTLERTITTSLGGAWFEIHDRVTNTGTGIAPHMILYHCNLGWPFIDERARIEGDPVAVVPRDADAEAAVGTWREVESPRGGVREQVLRHELRPGPVEYGVNSPGTGIRLNLSFDSEQLGSMFQWRMFGEGMNVLALEPCNTGVITGRAEARRAGMLVELQPGESREYRLRFAFGDSD